MRINNRVFKFILVLWISGMVVSVTYTLLTDRKTVGKQRELISSIHFIEIWSQLNVSLVPSSKPFLAMESDCSILFTKNGSLKCLYTLTGEVKWQTHVKLFSNELSSNNHFIFVSSPGPSEDCSVFTPVCESIRVTAYAVTSGLEVWANVYSGMGVVSQISANKSSLSIAGGGGHGTYHSAFKIDANTGELLDYHELELTIPLPNSFPNFANERGHIISNVVLEDGTYYFFTDDKTLWAIDEHTEEILAKAIFSPSESVDIVLITAQRDVVLIYFENSQQLFALQLKH